MTNNAAERALRCIAVGRNNWTFAGSDAGGRRAAAIYTLIETAKLNDVDPQAWLADVLARLHDHPAKRIAELLPWNWKLRSSDNQLPPERPVRSDPRHQLSFRGLLGRVRTSSQYDICSCVIGSTDLLSSRNSASVLAACCALADFALYDLK